MIKGVINLRLKSAEMAISNYSTGAQQKQVIPKINIMEREISHHKLLRSNPLVNPSTISQIYDTQRDTPIIKMAVPKMIYLKKTAHNLMAHQPSQTTEKICF